jgi:hypothetical protein
MSVPVFEGTTPLVSDRYTLTFIAGEDLLPGQLVEISADWTVKKCASVNSLKVVGITLSKALNGKAITVVNRGLCRAIAYGTITAGDQITSTSGGTGIGLIQSDQGKKDSSVMGVAVAGAASGGTAYIILW